MSSRNTLLVSVITAACALLTPNVALAGNGATVPGPGILALVALGVVVAIAVARSRK